VDDGRKNPQPRGLLAGLTRCRCGVSRQLHVPRAGAWGLGGWAHRHLFTRRRALRNGGRTPSIRRRRHRENPCQRDQRGASGARRCWRVKSTGGRPRRQPLPPTCAGWRRRSMFVPANRLEPSFFPWTTTAEAGCGGPSQAGWAHSRLYSGGSSREGPPGLSIPIRTAKGWPPAGFLPAWPRTRSGPSPRRCLPRAPHRSSRCARAIQSRASEWTTARHLL
jgi:hypothetical protein